MKLTNVGAIEEENIELQMTPMIDVVFLLLIFFVSTMQFKSVEGNLPAYLPKKKGASKERPDEVKQLGEIRIDLRKQDGAVLVSVNGSTLVGVGRKDPMVLLRSKLFLLNYSLEGATERPRVILDAKPDVPFGAIVQTINLCARYKFTDVSFAAPPPKT